MNSSMRPVNTSGRSTFERWQEREVVRARQLPRGARDDQAADALRVSPRQSHRDVAAQRQADENRPPIRGLVDRPDDAGNGVIDLERALPLRSVSGQVDRDAPVPVGKCVDLRPPHRPAHERAMHDHDRRCIGRPDDLPGGGFPGDGLARFGSRGGHRRGASPRRRRSPAAQLGWAPTSRRAPPRRTEVNGIRNSRNASIETRKPASRNTTARNFATANGPVTPKRLSVSPAEATNPPIAMSSVAGTRLCSRPRTSSRMAPGSDATKLTVSATGAMNRLNRKWSPGWLGSIEYGRTRLLGMNM